MGIKAKNKLLFVKGSFMKKISLSLSYLYQLSLYLLILSFFSFGVSAKEKISEQKICAQVVESIKNQLSGQAFQQEMDHCAQKLRAFYHIINKTGVFSAEESYQQEANFVCDLYQFSWLPANKQELCQKTVADTMRKAPANRLFNLDHLSNLLFSEGFDPYVKPVTQALGLKLNNLQLTKNQHWISCALRAENALANQMDGYPDTRFTKEILPYLQKHLSFSKAVFHMCQDEFNLLMPEMK